MSNPAPPSRPGGEDLRFTRTAAALLLIGALLFGAVAGGASALLLLNRAAQRTALPPASSADPASPRAAIQAASPVVVAITHRVAAQDDATPSARTGRPALGSGIVLDLEGHILTTGRVLGTNEDVRVVFGDGSDAPAAFIGLDRETGLSVLKANATGAGGEPTFARAAEPEPGQQVVALGTSPIDLSRTVDVGTVAALGQEAELGGRQQTDNLILTDAKAPSGGSGGPLVNADGEVLGVSVGESADGAWSLVLPARTARDIARRIIKVGAGNRASLGIYYETITPQLDGARKLPQQGALVTTVLKRSPAAEKLRQGDVITAVEGKVLNQEQTLDALLSTYEPGKVVKLQVVRNGNSINMRVKLSRKTAPAATPNPTPPTP